MREHEEEIKKTHPETSPGDYAKEVHTRNSNAFEETDERNRKALYPSHHEESDEHGPEQAKAKKEE